MSATDDDGPARPDSLSRRGALLWGIGAALGIGVIATLHYTASHADGAAPHQLYRRLFYVPIVISAWVFGRRGGLVAAAATVLLYVPHAFGLLGLHRDPASVIDKGAEMVLYVGIGALVGTFVDRERGIAVRVIALLREREQSLTQRDRLLREKEVALASRDRLLEERAATIAQRDAALVELRDTQASLSASEQHAAMGYLTAGLAHEIRNPLGSILGSAEILRDALSDDARDRRIADLLIRETQRLNEVLTRFLRFAGQEPRREEPTDLSELTEEVLALVAAEAKQRSVRISHVRCSAMPTMPIEASQVRQVILNLLVNAMQVQPEGGQIRVVSGHEAEGGRDSVFVRVEDSGPGVPPEERTAVFHPYYSTRDGGTGLGLAISRRVATEHGGSLSVRDSPLGGAAFELRLPVRGESAGQLPLAPPEGDLP